MSVAATDWVFDHSEATGAARLVLLVIARHIGSNGEGAWPSFATIASQARITRNTVIAALTELEALGELVVLRGQGPSGRGGKSNLYELTKWRGERASSENSSGAIHGRKWRDLNTRSNKKKKTNY